MNAALQKFDDQCHAEYIASAWVQDIAAAAAEQVYDNAMAALVTPFAAAACLKDVLRLVSWAQTAADKCDALQDSGCCDASEEEPAAAEIDTWARGHVPTRAKSRPSYDMLQQLKMDSQSGGPGSDGGRSGKSGKSAGHRRATPRTTSRLASQGSSLNRGQMAAAMRADNDVAAAAAAASAEPQQSAAAIAKDMAAFLGGASSAAAAVVDKSEATKNRALESARREESERRATAAAAERAAAERLEKAIRYATVRTTIKCVQCRLNSVCS
jgi:hypothetical protein